jgi:transposase
MRAYSQDLRERVIAALEAGEHSQAEIAEMFNISLPTVENWWRRWRTTHSVAAWPYAGGPTRTLEPYADFLRAEVARRPDATLDELCARVAEVHGVEASRSMMCRELQHLRLPLKKRASTTASAIRRA